MLKDTDGGVFWLHGVVFLFVFLFWFILSIVGKVRRFKCGIYIYIYT